MSLAIVTQFAAPFTVPLLFWVLDINSLDINKLMILKDIAILVFIPMIVSQVIKKFLPHTGLKDLKSFSRQSMSLSFSFIFITISSQRGTHSWQYGRCDLKAWSALSGLHYVAYYRIHIGSAPDQGKAE